MNRTIIIALTFLTSCYTKQTEKVLVGNNFNLPTIIQNTNIDTVKAFKVEGVTGIYPQMIGKFKFGDTINLFNLGQERMSEKDYLWEIKNVDDNDSLSSDGLQIIPDYKTSVAYSRLGHSKNLYFPVYIINDTHESKIFFGKDNHGFAIQEAIDTSDYSLWHPIESTGYDFCGNGRFRKKLNPKEFLIFLLPKYFGSDTTSLRVRFKIGESVLISKTYLGTINSKQFNIDKTDWIYDKLKESKGGAANFLFYGGQPKGIWN